jgi:type I restriction enzyme S subunit
VNLKSGFGAGKQDQDQEEKGIIQIRPTNIGTEGNLKFDKNVFLPLELLETLQDNLLQKGDVLFNNTNSQELVGKTVYFDEDGDFLFSNHITRIRANENEVSPQYLALILNTYQHRKIFYSICTNWNNQSGVGNDLLNSLRIPVPPLEIQEEIAAHIQAIRTRAKDLEHEAQAKVERAKAEVEQMILGEVSAGA